MIIGNPLNAKGSIVDEEFQIEVGDVGTSVAETGIVKYKSLDCFAECDVGIFDLFNKGLPMKEVLLFPSHSSISDSMLQERMPELHRPPPRCR